MDLIGYSYNLTMKICIVQPGILRPRGVRTLVILEGVTGLLLLLIGVVLVNLGLLNLTAPGSSSTFTDIGAVEIALALVSFVSAAGLWMRNTWSQTLSMAVAVITALYNAAIIALAATLTGGSLYPAGATVVLILINDVIIAEMPLMFLVTRPRVSAYLGKAPMMRS
jgi:hypothetical protein